jgi:hypothetical protein
MLDCVGVNELSISIPRENLITWDKCKMRNQLHCKLEGQYDRSLNEKAEQQLNQLAATLCTNEY